MINRRYSVRQTILGIVMLTVHDECALGVAGEEREFWVPDTGGYVRELFPGRPGTLGQQVCNLLAHSGSTLTTTRAGLIRLIRLEARALMLAVERDERRPDRYGR